MRPTLAYANHLTTRLAVLAFAAAATPAAAIETIDCSQDRGSAERAICASHHLQILDATVAQAYAEIMHDSGINRRVKSAVHESQLEFLARRDACGHNTECLTEVMERRATRIHFYY